MNFNSKKLAIVAVTLALTAAALNSPAEARRYKHKVMRHTAMTSMSYNSGDHLHAHLAGANAAPMFRPAYAGGVRGRYTYRHATPRVWRAARQPALRHVATRHVATRRVATRHVGTRCGRSSPRARPTRQCNRPPRCQVSAVAAVWSHRPANISEPTRPGWGPLVRPLHEHGSGETGRRGTGSNMANSFANYGSRVSGPQVGAIAVMSRGKRGGHVGIVSGMDRREIRSSFPAITTVASPRQ